MESAMSRIAHLPVNRVDAAGTTHTTDAVSVEEPLEILIGDRNLSITMRTPGHDEELAAGFLFTEGLIHKRDDIRSISASENRATVDLVNGTSVPDHQDRRFTMTSACGVCGKASIDSLYASGCTPVPDGTFTIDAKALGTLPALLRRAQVVFDQTGGIHAAGLFDAEGNLEILREDVGRHNAVDKVIGALFLNSAIFTERTHDRMLLVSGRASFELVQKAAIAGIPVLAAIGAPSTLAVETAIRFNLTLIGFLRDACFNIYSGFERVQPSFRPE